MTSSVPDVALQALRRGRPAPCPGPHVCDHSDLEHYAFDRGVRDGEAGVEHCPYKRPVLREAWFTGQSSGKLNRPSKGAR